MALSRVMHRTTFDDEHEQFRASFRRFLDKEFVPRIDEFDRAGITDRELFPAAGELGFLGFAAPEEHGGSGADDFRYSLVIAEETHASGAASAMFGIRGGATEVRPECERWIPV